MGIVKKTEVLLGHKNASSCEAQRRRPRLPRSLPHQAFPHLIWLLFEIGSPVVHPGIELSTQVRMTSNSRCGLHHPSAGIPEKHHYVQYGLLGHLPDTSTWTPLLSSSDLHLTFATFSILPQLFLRFIYFWRRESSCVVWVGL